MNTRGIALVTGAGSNQVAAQGVNVFLFSTDLSPAGSAGDMITVDLTNSKIIMKGEGWIQFGGYMMCGSSSASNFIYSLIIKNGVVFYCGTVHSGPNNGSVVFNQLFYAKSGDEFKFGAYFWTNATLYMSGDALSTTLWARIY